VSDYGIGESAGVKLVKPMLFSKTLPYGLVASQFCFIIHTSKATSLALL
jgi:hypothetical protein